MANRASVSLSAIIAASEVCQMTAQGFSDAARALSAAFENAGQDWDDEKYARLGGIVSECNASLVKATNKLSEHMETLQKIATIIGEYEEVNI